MSSSLSRALQRENTQGKGAFEACFAQGLDLSELGGGATAAKNQRTSAVSASAALLQVKAKESQQRQQQDQEDVRLEQLAKSRADNLKALQKDSKNFSASSVLSRQRPDGVGHSKMVGSLLVHIHQGDDKVSGKGRFKGKQGMKQIKQKPIGNSKPQFFASKSQKGKSAIKSKRRSKY